jgi:hypothetical protein
LAQRQAEEKYMKFVLSHDVERDVRAGRSGAQVPLGRRLAAAVIGTALLLPSLAACAGEVETTQSGAARGASDPAESGASGSGNPGSKQQQSIELRRKEENLIAACMRKSGFTYVPHVPEEMLHPAAQRRTDYAALKTFRSKYGFGSFAVVVYPGDPNVAPAAADDPNAATADRLSGTQKAAYERALYGNDRSKGAMVGGCIGDAVKAVDPAAWKRAEFQHKTIDRAAKANGGAVSSNDVDDTLCGADPGCAQLNSRKAELKPLEGPYAACLRGKGYAVEAVGDITQAASATVSARFDKLNTSTDPFKPQVDPAIARTELKNEVKVALEDLECGKDYLVARGKLEAQAAELAPPSGGLE